MSDVSPFMVTQINVSLPSRLNGTLLSATGIVRHLTVLKKKSRWILI